MVLALSLVIALTLLSLRLVVQSRILITNDDEAKRGKLIDYVQKFTLALFIPIGIIMAVLGFTFSFFGDSFISVGFTLLGTSIALLIQGESLKKTGDSAKSYGKKVHTIALIFWWVALIGVVALVAAVLVNIFK